MTDRRRPENAALRKQWVTIAEYMREFSLSRPMLYKLAHFQLITLKRITLPGRSKPKVWVENAPPRDDSATS
jgi:hypothetical protein